MKRNARYLIGIAICIAVVSVGYVIYKPASPVLVQDSRPTAVLAGHTLHLLIANTPVLREQGLSGRSGLSPDEGMLFTFDHDGEYAFWMKDMLFSIDIVWAASDGSIVYIAQSASPDSYPEAFKPSIRARYVLELPAGWTKQNNVRVGDIIHL